MLALAWEVRVRLAQLEGKGPKPELFHRLFAKNRLSRDELGMIQRRMISAVVA